VLGYPNWHPKAKKFPQRKGNKNSRAPKVREPGMEPRTTAQASSFARSDKPAMMLTQQQKEQLLKLLP